LVRLTKRRERGGGEWTGGEHKRNVKRGRNVSDPQRVWIFNPCVTYVRGKVGGQIPRGEKGGRSQAKSREKIPG